MGNMLQITDYRSHVTARRACFRGWGFLASASSWMRGWLQDDDVDGEVEEKGFYYRRL